MYEKRTKSGVIADFVKAMDDTSFPCVKCPAGCFAYMDECCSLTFNHFLAWKLDVSVFDADSELC